MIMPIALAKDGFIQKKSSATNVSANCSFLDFLNKIFTFVDKDLQNFDGNSFIIENDYNPTNSLFIYSNDKGTFLYQVQTAIPFLHMNKMLWECTCYNLEKIENINSILNVSGISTVAELKNGCWGQLSRGLNLTEDNENMGFSGNRDFEYDIKIKDNFKATNKNVKNLTYGFLFDDDTFCIKYYTLKIKFVVNPTELNLVSNSADGSFSFFYIIAQKYYKDPLLDNVLYTKFNPSGSKILNLYDIISQYSPNIKSIELLPFLFNDYRYNVDFDGGINDTYISINNIADATKTKVTDLGLFYDSDCSTKLENSQTGTQYDEDLFFYLSSANFPSELVFGGGVRGFLRTPVGNIQLDFSTNLWRDRKLWGNVDDTHTETVLESNCLYKIVKGEGWRLDGIFKCDVPPIYLNFYTDNAGQVFIQNMTTNAQELRQINRDYINTTTNAQSSYVANTLASAISNSTNLLNLSLLGSISSFGANAIQHENTKQQNKNNYELAKANYEDKIKTEALLSKFTGKEIVGNANFTEFFKTLGSNFFQLYFETNYSVFKKSTGYTYVVQKDYDYSIDLLPNNFFNSFINDTDTTDARFVKKENNVNFLSKIFNYKYAGGTITSKERASSGAVRDIRFSYLVSFSMYFLYNSLTMRTNFLTFPIKI